MKWISYMYTYILSLLLAPIPPIKVLPALHSSLPLAVYFTHGSVYMGEGNGNPLQYSCLENPMGGGAWWAAVHGVTKSRTWLSNFTFTFHFHAWEKEMATHSSVLAWRIPGTGEPGGLPSMGSHRIGHNWSDLAAAAVYICQSNLAVCPPQPYPATHVYMSILYVSIFIPVVQIVSSVLFF